MSQKFINFHFIPYFVRVLLALLAFFGVLMLAIPIGFYGMAMYLYPSLPSVSEIKTANLEMPLQIYSEDNKLVGQYGNRMSLPVTYQEVPKDLINAFLAAEDSTFFEHSGISIKGLGRAVTEVITQDQGQTGGSTITMQVAKNYFLTPERTFSRKLTELYLARRIEDELTKNEILTLYVNKIYMGEGAYGIKAAAKKYYSKSLEDLTIAEMATLAGLPKAPSQNNPVSNPNEAIERRNWILGRMYSLGYISQTQYENAQSTPLNVRLYQVKYDVPMPYLSEMTRHALVNRYGEAVVNSGWRVKLTVNSQAQISAQKAIAKGLIGYDRRHGWRGVEASGEPLSDFITFGHMQPAKVIDVQNRSFIAELKNGEVVTIPWSGMSWAKKYKSANRISSYPNRASDIVAKDDIIRVMPNDDSSGWQLTQIPHVQGSLVSLDPDTGGLRALIGGFDYRYSKFNRAIQGWRQPGSTIKPLIYSAALEKGYRPDSLVSDSPLRVGDWKPRNSDGRFYGPITLRRGLYLSRNLVSIRLLQSIGTPDARHLLDQFGLDQEKLPTTLSLALGAGQATPLQMATAYATFANGGHRIQPYFIDEIFNYDAKLLYKAHPQRACANCFNETLEDTNADLQKDFIKQLEVQNLIHNTAVDLLRNHPSILSDLEQGAILKVGEPKKDDESVYEVTVERPTDNQSSDLGNGNETNANVDGEQLMTEVSDSELTETNIKPFAPAVNTKEYDLLYKLYSLYYTGSPQSDRLEPTLTQYTMTTQAPRILTARVAYEMAGILRDVVQRGTGRRALALGRNDIGGKTGTTNEMKDAWFAGFQPTLVTVVWVGFDQPATLGRGEYGGVAALPIWIDYMGDQLKDTPKQWVHLNDKAKSKKRKREVVNVTDRGTSSRSDGSDSANDNSSSSTASSRSDDKQTEDAQVDHTSLPKPNVIRREPEPEPNDNGTDGASRPLEINTVKELPPI